VGQRGGTLYFKIEPSILGRLHSVFFFFGSDGPIELAHCKKMKNEIIIIITWEAPDVINRRGRE
jgi:hypothetical protein